MFGLQAQNAFGCCTINSGTLKATNTMAWAEVYLGDRRPPVLTTATPASRDWTDEPAGTQHTIGVGVHDDGLGIYGIGLEGAASGGGFVRHGCFGHIDHGPCPPDWSRSITYTLNEGVNALTAYGQDFVDNRTAGGTWTEKIDRSAPSITELSGSLHAARDRDDDRRFMGLYNDAYALRVRASDAHSGVREIEVYVDNQSQRSRGGYTTGGALDWTLRPDDHSDGQHTVEVVIRDNVAGQAGAADDRHVVRRTFSVTVDRRGDIYRSTEYSDNPATGAEPGAREAVKVRTSVSRSDDGASVTTRTNVACTDGESSGPRCAEWRSRSYEELEEQDYTVYRGSSPDDPRVREAAYIASTRHFRVELAASTGSPLTSVLEPWQVRPPAAGGTYEVHEIEETLQTNADPGGDADEGVDQGSTEVKAMVRVWLDSATRLPLRSEVRAPDGTVIDRLYWTYEVSRLEAHEVPDDYFSVGSPLSPGVDERVQMRGTQALAPQTDTETGKSIRPWHLGELGQLLLGPTLCLVDRHVIRVSESRAGDTSTLLGSDAADPLQPMTILGAAYDFVDTGGTCTPGNGSLDNPAVTIEVAHRDSALGQLWRQQQVDEATAIQNNPTSDDFLLGGLVPVVIDASPTVAYVTTLADNTITALVESGDDAILIKGEITKLQLPPLAALLRTS